MKRVVILAPSTSSDLPLSADASASSDAIAWLGAALAERGFRVTVADEADFAGDIKRAAEGTTDALLVHLSGRLARKGVLRAGGGRWLTLRDVGAALAALPCPVCVIVELLHEEEGSDALSAAEHVASIVSAIRARERGYTMVSAVRPAKSDAPPLAFTRLLLAAADDAGAEPALSAAYERVTSLPEGLAAAQSFTLVRGDTDVSLSAAPAPPSQPEPAGALEEALAPDAVEADFEALVAAATDARDWARVVELRRERLASQPSEQARARELVAIARVLQVEMGLPEEAIAALEEARTLAPTRVGVLQALRRGYEKLGRWASAIEVVSALAGLEQSSAARAALRVALASMVLEHLQDEERAVSLFSAALKDDPSNSTALAALQRLRPPPPAGEEGKIQEIVEEQSTRELPTFRDSVPPSERVAVAPGNPLDPATHAQAFEARMRAGEIDAAFLSALALEELGAARPEHAALIAKRRTTRGVRPRAPFDDAAWARLRASGADHVLETLFAAVSRAGSAARVEQLIARDRLVALDPATRIEENSTASVWRTFQWASTVLAVPFPGIYVVDEVPGDIAAVRAEVPSTAVAPTVATGRSAKELAFLAGRHLTYYRPAHQVLIFFPTHDELERLLLASVELVLPGATGATDSRAVTALKARLERLVTADERALIADASRRLVARGGQASLARWARSVELAAGRAGLFLCGDLATATATVDIELRGIAGLTGEDRRNDLIAFATSEPFATLRRELLILDEEPGQSVIPRPAR
jgi:tetratricopeptide (TPR) repeat protein